jgi:hypothetical protein
MKYLTRLLKTPIIPAFFFLTFPETLDAYLDPGTGSIILQAVIGVAAGGLLAVGLFWSRVKTFFGNLFSRGGKHGNEGKQD